MDRVIRLSPTTFQLVERRAREMQTTPEQIAETVLRLQLGGTVHLEQRLTQFGVQTYVRGTRVAVRHIWAFLEAGHTIDEIIQQDLPHVSRSAIYEAISYAYDHRAEVEAELAANMPDAIQTQFHQLLPADKVAALTGRVA